MCAQVNIRRLERLESSCSFGNSAHPDLNSLDIARFWAKVRLAPNGCLEWTGSCSGGKGRKLYGQFTFNRDGRRAAANAHRIAWVLAHGPIPPGFSVCHRCDNGRCVDVAHLFLGTQTDNMRDASEKGRLSLPRARNRGIKADVIATYLAGGITADALAGAYGVHRLTVLRWIRAATDGADQRVMRHRRTDAA